MVKKKEKNSDLNIFQANAKYMLKPVWLNEISFVQTFK